MNPMVSILIPHYKTLDLTKLCLRSIRKYSDADKIKIFVIDNGSKDESTEYLKTIPWIELIERDVDENESPAESHSNALDLALSKVETPYVLSIHTDTIVCHPEWLNFLLEEIEAEDDIAGVGSWKLEYKPFIKRLFKKIEGLWQGYIWYPLVGKGDGHIEGRGENYYYLRSHCALYRTELLKKYTNGFNDGGETAGKVLHRKLIENGFKMNFLSSLELGKYIQHLNHATMILNPEIAGRKTGGKKERKRIQRQLNSVNYRDMLAASDLDQ